MWRCASNMSKLFKYAYSQMKLKTQPVEIDVLHAETFF